MRSVVFHQFGAPHEVLVTEDRPMPVPGAGYVRVKLLQAPIHNHDLAIVRGVYGYRPPLPAAAGTEALGTVEALGAEVSEVAVGQRVVGAGLQGAWAEFFLARAAALVPVPAAIPDDVACQLLAMPLSAYMVIEDLGLEAGAWIIQNAAAGAVGRMVDTLAAERGIQVINLVRRAAGVRELAAAGVKHALFTEDESWPRQAAALTGGAPIVAALDSVGGKLASQMVDLLGFGGTLLSFGALSGEPLLIDPRALIFKQTTVRGFWATKVSERTSRQDKGRMIGDLVRLAAAGRLPLQVSTRFSLSEPGRAAVAAETPGRTGKVVLRAG